MISLDHLNPQQRQAVTTTHGPLLLLAGAGSGKTRVITYRMAYLIDNKQIPAAQVLAVTFTNKAAKEMEERLGQMLGSLKKGATLCTFHSLGVRILRKYIHLLGYQSNFTIYDDHDQQEIMNAIVEDYDHEATLAMKPKEVHYKIMQAKGKGLGPEYFLSQQYDLKMIILGRVYQRYQEVLKGCNAVDFEDILVLTTQLFQHHEAQLDELYNRYRYLLVDEYQDTNRVQYELLRHLTKYHRNLCVVGDDDQSIYGWRGADIQNILNFEKDYPEVQVIKLEQNYRSTQNILSAANQVISQNTQRMSKKLWSQQGLGKSLGWLKGADEKDELEKVVSQIRLEILRESRLLSDYAILYRSNFQSRVIEEALREVNLPYYVVGAASFYDRKEIKDSLAYARLLNNPLDEVSLQRVINFPRRGIGKTSLVNAYQCARDHKINIHDILYNASKFDKISKEASLSMQRFIRMIHDYKELLKTKAFPQVIEEMFTQIGFLAELEKSGLDGNTKERKVHCVLEWLNGLRQYQEKYPQKTLQDYLERITLFTNEDDADASGNRISLLTFHSAKGLEFPYVFMVGMAEGVFPHKRAVQESGDAEERRLCYVGITRAQKELTLSMAKKRTRFKESFEQQPSRFIEDIARDLFLIPPDGKISNEQKVALVNTARANFFKQIGQS